MLAQVIIDGQQSLDPSFTERFVVPALPFFEILYYLSSFGLLIVAIIGLKQISLGRQIAVVNARRDALKVSAEQCKLYSDTILPFSSTLRSNQLYQLYTGFLSFSVKDSTIYVTPKDSKIDVDKYLVSLDSNFLRFFNAIESFSQYFTSGLADEENAYECLGNVHLSIASPYIPLLALRDQARCEHNWRNTLKLFVTWYARQQLENIEYKKSKLSHTTELLENEEALHTFEPISVLDVDTFYKWKFGK